MNINYTPPECIKKTGEEVIYCVPFDRDVSGGFVSGGYAAVTKRALYITRADKVIKEYPLCECEEISCNSMIGGGELVVKSKSGTGAERAVLFSSKHISRFASVAAGAQLLIEGSDRRIENREYETVCPNCGRGLPKTKNCPHCRGGSKHAKSRIADICRDNKKSFVIISLLMLLSSLLSIAGPDVQKRFIDASIVNNNGTLSDVAEFVLVMLVITVLTIAVNILKNLACARLGTSVALKLRQKLYYKVQILTMSFIDDRRPGMIMNRIMGDPNAVKDFMQDAFGNMFAMIITMVLALVYMITIDPVLTLVSVIFVPVVVVLTALWRKNVHRRFHMQWKKNDKANSALQDVISGMRVVKSFGKEKQESENIDSVNIEYAALQKKNEVFWATFYPWLIFIMGAGIYFVTFFGGFDVLNSRMSIGTLTQFIAYAGILYGPLDWLTRLPQMIARTATSIERIYDILDEEPDISEPPDAVEHEINGEIELKNVTFGYHSYDPVLKNIDLKVKPGEMIGLVGASGTGKSTLINLLMHLYEADDGEILIDGVNINNIKSDCYHSQLGIVLQETFLFSGTILNNLRFAKPDASLEEIIMAAKMANAHDFICKTPDGYNTYVGEHGYNLSGGQRQRIAIARAILNDPRLLILDEATSNLDTESEFLIQKALSRLTTGRTTFAIAHRLSTLKDADRIVVIEGHAIAEVGSHEELLHKKGIYYSLVTAQLEMQTLEDIE